MKTTTNLKKLVSRKALTTMSVAIVIASFVMTTVWQIPQAIATSLEEIKETREISAPVDKVWTIVSDLDNETNIGLWLKLSRILTRQII